MSSSRLSHPETLTASQTLLILDHCDMAVRIATKYARRLARHVQVDDIVSLANLGLINAARDFDPEIQDISFPAYARVKMHGAILDGLREMDWAPRSVRRATRELESARDDGSVVKLAAEDIARTESALHRATLVSMDATETYVYVEAKPVDEETPELRHAMNIAVDTIEEHGEPAITIFALYYHRHMKLGDIADQLGLSVNKVSAVHKEVVLELTAMIRALYTESPTK